MIALEKINIVPRYLKITDQGGIIMENREIHEKLEGLEIFEYDGEGYDPTMSFENWRVAIANFGKKFDRESYNMLERHMLTDEVFVLLRGEASLIIGKELREYKMKPYRIYNVKAGVWHNVLIERGAKVLVVENHDTSDENSEEFYLQL